MDVDVSPAVEPAEHRALLRALEHMDVRPRGTKPYDRAWRHAGLREAVAGEDDEDVGYAFSPRKTRGATRA